jgi:hypothetical protein
MMLQEHEKAQIRAILDLLHGDVFGFRTRRPQLETLAAVATALGGAKRNAVREART